MSAVANPAATPAAVSLPEGGGAIAGLGETFRADPQTGTGSLTVPIELPPGRGGLAPDLALSYGSGNGNGPFGIGWMLTVPSVARKTSTGVPRYRDADPDPARQDTFVMTGQDELVAVPPDAAGDPQRFRPRTEGAFGRIEHLADPADPARDVWEVRGRDGHRSVFGGLDANGQLASVGDPAGGVARIFSWALTRTVDAFGNRIEYLYERDAVRTEDPPRSHRWDQLYLSQIRYADNGDPDDPEFLVTVTFGYEERPDPFSSHRAGFEIRTTRRCTTIAVAIASGGVPVPERTYHLGYADPAPLNAASLLTSIALEGLGSGGTESVPPLLLSYREFDPAHRELRPVPDAELPPRPIGDPSRELIDLSGDGLPDLVELGETPRWWRNRGDGRFTVPQLIPGAPGGIRLADPGVQLVDADGDGRADVLVSRYDAHGYVPIGADGPRGPDAFHRYGFAPTFSLEDPAVRLVDLTGDGVTDAVRSGSQIECYFANPDLGWDPAVLRHVPRAAAEEFPNLDFADPRVSWADMTGDGLTDPVLVHDGVVDYWPSCGHGDWGPRVTMRQPADLPPGYDPRRVLLADVDGDGLADLIYLGTDSLTLWINQAGNGWSTPILVPGTPLISEIETVRVVDLLGSGVAGILWGSDASNPWQLPVYFLDFTGGGKPYLLTGVDNNRGASTSLEYTSSTRFLVDDDASPATRWRTSLPFPVQVIHRVVVTDRLSGDARTTEYRYRHGLWDGRDREFRGFALVEEADAEIPAAGATGPPPVLTRSWFHVGAVPLPGGDAQPLDLSSEYWVEDPQLLTAPAGQAAWLAAMTPTARRDALRALRGRLLRQERYVRDGTPAAARPQSVSETLHGLVPLPVGVPPAVPAAGWQARVHFPHELATRYTSWERGTDPHTTVTFTDGYDRHGQPGEHTLVALPRASVRRTPMSADLVGSVDVDDDILHAVHTRTERAVADPGLELHDRVAHERTFAPSTPPRVTETAPGELAAVLRDQVAAARVVHARFTVALRAWSPGTDLPASVRLLTHDVRRYDGAAFTGRPPGEVGPYGALSCVEALVVDDDDLTTVYGAGRPAYLGGAAALPAGTPPGFGADLGYRRAVASAAGYHDGWYAYRDRRRYDVQDAAAAESRGLVVATCDALGQQTALEPDPTWMFPARITDPLGLVTTVEYDRLRISRLTDANGHAVRVGYTPLGQVARVVHERRGGGGGSNTAPEVEFRYDLGAYARTRAGPQPQPVWVHHRRRVWHADDPDDDGSVVEARQYSDGFGRLIQSRTEAEELAFGADTVRGDDVGLPSAASVAPSAATARRDAGRVVVSEWQDYDAKGRVATRYEPFFGTGWDYQPEAEARVGRRTAFTYDATGRPALTVAPDGSRTLVVYGVPDDLAVPTAARPTAWETTRYDANDLAPLSSAPGGGSLATGAPTAHHFTPRSERVDAFGRVVASIDRPGPDPARSVLTRRRFDEQGREVEVIDPAGRTAQTRHYDRLGRPLREDSIDAGTTSTVVDAAGNPVDVADADGRRTLRVHDGGGRLAQVWARDRASDPMTLRENVVHGDVLPDRTAAQQANLLGRIAVHYDEAGVQEFSAYDSRGNVTDRVRRVIGDAAVAAGWTADWSVSGAAAALDASRYEVTTRYDALDRLVEMRCPDDRQGAGHRPVFRMSYGKGGTLTGVSIDGVPYVYELAHDAHGQRLLARYGNGVLVRYAYDPATRRLARVRSEPCVRTEAADGTLTWTGSGAPLQDHALSYDLAGNLIAVEERVAGCGVAGSQHGRDRLVRVFAYDALYRLSSATGRACSAIAGPRPIEDLRRCGAYVAPAAAPNQANAPDLTEHYTEEYAWDPVGNLVGLTYRGGSTWTRGWGLGGRTTPGSQGAPNNRATLFQDGVTSHSYAYDAGGNLASSDTDGSYTFDHAGRLTSFIRRAGTGPPSVEVRYLYGADGTRVKRWVGRGGTQTETVVHIDRCYEHHPDTPGGPGVRLHVMDGLRRIAVVRRGPAYPDDAGPAEQYHLEDSTRSSHVVVDGTGSWVNREEYFPFGETSFGSFARKRYRHQGHERDDVTGLDLHDARWYAPWLGRWVSCDPAGLLDGTNRYGFARGGPMGLVDPSGLQAESAQAAAATPAAAQDAPQGPQTHVFIVGTDNNYHDNPDNFPRALDTLLNKPTRERFRESVKMGDRIVVMVPPTMSKELRDRITASLQRFRDGLDVRPTTPPPGASPGEDWFTVSLDVKVELRQVKEVDVAKAVNELQNVRNLYYFGHGVGSGPRYDFGGRTDFPPADSFRATPFAPDARAVFCTCNSWQYAEKFTKTTGVPSTGVQGTSYFGKSEVSAGKLDPGARAGTAVRWEYVKIEGKIITLGPTSLSQPKGVPFLRLRHEFRPLQPPRPAPIAR